MLDNQILNFIPDASKFFGWKWSDKPWSIENMMMFSTFNGDAE